MDATYIHAERVANTGFAPMDFIQRPILCRCDDYLSRDCDGCAQLRLRLLLARREAFQEKPRRLVISLTRALMCAAEPVKAGYLTRS